MDRETFLRLDSAVRLATSHIIEHGCDDIFRQPGFADPYEMAVIRENQDAFEKKARSETLDFVKVANLTRERIGPVYRYLIPKDLYTYRTVHWLDPFDAVKYLSVAIILFEDIDRQRASTEHGVCHSHRKATLDGVLFDTSYGYDTFREASGRLTRSSVGKWKVVTDISVFFERIGNHPLENHLRDAGCIGKYVALTREMLFQWAGDRRSHGIPVGGDASRILAEAALLAVDRKLLERGVKYIRYVDDFRIVAESREEAYEHMRLLSELLADEGLFVNHKKTFVRQITDDEIFSEAGEAQIAEEHEAIDENERVAKLIKVRVSGRSVIARRYVQPGKEAIETLKTLSKDDVVERFLECAENDKHEQLKLVIKFFLYVDHDPALIALVLKNQISAIIYTVDALVKEGEKLSGELRNQIKEVVFETMGGLKCGYPFHISLIRLFSSPGFEDSRNINHVVDSARVSDNAMFLREAIFLGYAQLDRQRIRKLALELYPIVQAPTQRAIFFATSRYPRMSAEEKRPIIRNMRQTSDDWFINSDRFEQPVEREA